MSRAGRGREPSMVMAPGEVVRLLDALHGAGVRVWVDGGWGVDALLGEERREHDDLDLVVAMEDVEALTRVLNDLGYTHQRRGAPLSFELVDPNGRQVDVHPVTFDPEGNGLYLMEEGTTWTYPSDGLKGSGVIGARSVACLTPELQMRVHSGYGLGAKDHEEIRVLHEKFGVPPPPDYECPEPARVTPL
jgi:lincosamide nucleotidyltransferase A/C/D/E